MDVASPLVLEQAAKAGYSTVVGYDIDPHDYQDPGALAIVERVRAGLHPGAIVSLHTAHEGTVTARSGGGRHPSSRPPPRHRKGAPGAIERVESTQGSLVPPPHASDTASATHLADARMMT